MRTAFLLSLTLSLAIPVFGQTPAPGQAPSKPAPAAPATPAPSRPRAPRRAAAAGARSGIAMVVTDQNGAMLSGVHVELTGPVEKSGDTDTNGQVNFPGLQAGTYRLRFTGDNVTTLDRDVTVRGGAIEHLDIKLASAAPRREAAAPAPAAAPATGPVGSPQIGSVANLADRERNSKEPRREVLLSCSANTRTELLVLQEEQPERLYKTAEATFYVISGQGSAKVGELQSVIGTGSFVAVPRGTAFSLARQGKNPLVLLWTLSGEPCEQAR